MERAKLRYRPEWDGVERMVINMIRSQEWRFPHDIDFDDVYQEAYVLFDKLRTKYTTVTEPKHFMVLMKRSLQNMITNTANRRTRRNEILVSQLVGSGEAGEGDSVVESGQLQELCSPDYYPDLEARLMLEDCPPIIRQVLEALKANPPCSYKIKPNRTRETINEYLSRIMGLDPAIRVVDIVDQFIRGEVCRTI